MASTGRVGSIRLLRGYLCGGLHRLAHRGERWIGRGGQRAVVEADDRDVVGHAAARLGERLKDAHRGQIARREDRVRAGPLT